MSKLRRIAASVSRNREWVALLLFAALLYAMFEGIPKLDARSGIDGFGDLYNAVMMAVKGLLAVSLAWACKAHFWSELSDVDEERCAKTIEGSAYTKGALTMIYLDRVGWVFWLGWWSWVIF